MQTMRFSKLHPAAIAPTRKHPEDAGTDFYSLESTTIAPHRVEIVHTGVTVEVPAGYCLQLWPKSRNNHLVGAGIVDAGYQGEILVKVVNFSDSPLEIKAGDAIAQGVLVPVLTPALEFVPLNEIHAQATSRGATGGITSQASKA